MSGSGGGGGGFSDEAVDCASLRVTTVLASPNPTAEVKVGDRLEVKLIADPGVSVVCMNAKKEVVGALAFGDVRKLIKCIESGNDYVATVKTIEGARKTVEIKHK